MRNTSIRYIFCEVTHFWNPINQIPKYLILYLIPNTKYRVTNKEIYISFAIFYSILWEANRQMNRVKNCDFKIKSMIAKSISRVDKKKGIVFWVFFIIRESISRVDKKNGVVFWVFFLIIRESISRVDKKKRDYCVLSFCFHYKRVHWTCGQEKKGFLSRVYFIPLLCIIY